MGFSITDSGNGLLTALLIIVALGVAVPVVIWFVMIVRQARASVLEDSEHDLEA